MSKSNNDQTLLIPGRSGWDLWTLQGKQLKLLKNTSEELALEIGKVPGGKELNMAFPVRELTALTLWAPKTDSETVQGLIELQIEKTGLAQTHDLGTLTQHSQITNFNEDKDLYLIDTLRAPAEGMLPATSPTHFNTSPSCFSFAPNTVTLWQEFNRWVMAISNPEGEVVYYQGLTTSVLEPQTIQEIRFICTQLQLQKVISESPQSYICWTEEPSIKPEGFDQIAQELGESLSLVNKPAPHFTKGGTLLPADTRANRLSAKKKQQQSLFTTIAAVLLIGLIGYAIYNLLEIENEAKTAQIKADRLTEENQVLLDHNAKWAELAVLVETETTPINLLKGSHSVIPNKELRFLRAEFIHQATPDGFGTEVSVTITGEAPSSGIALDFDERLQKHALFDTLTWNNPAPSKSDTGWKFIYQAEQEQPQQ